MRYHGVDLHKASAAVSVRNETGSEVRYLPRVTDFGSYVATLTAQDTVVMECCPGSFWWAERIQRQGVRCTVIDTFRFRIIRASWHKTDRRDAAALSLALWMSAQTGELVLPEVWKPTPVVRELRRLFSQWQLLNNLGEELTTALPLSPASVFSVSMGLKILATLMEQKKNLQREIYLTGRPIRCAC